jgi:hypothetical protein
MPLSAPLIILGQLASASFAAGLNLYLTVALFGLGSRLGWIPSLPPGLKGLENMIVITTAILLYAVEFFIDKIPHADSLWDALHTVIRPLGAGLLAGLALNAASTEMMVGAAVFAAFVALAAHGTKAGLRIALNTAPSTLRSSVISTIEDICAAALALVALAYPVVALATAAGLAVLLLLFGPRVWRAGALAVRALQARRRAFFGSRGWSSLRDVPPRLRQLVEVPPLGRGEPRAVRAAFRGLPGVSAYRNGWVVLSNDHATFVYSSMLGSRSLPLPPIRQPEVHRGLWTDTVEFRVNGSRCTLFLLKDGPATEVALADLMSAA